MFTAILKKFNPLFLCFFLGLWCAPLFGQTAAELEELLQIQAISYAQAARFVLEAADAVSPQDAAQAYAFAMERSWLPKKAAAGESARLNGVSLLLMRSFAVKGGMWYTLIKSPHWAYRELLYQDIIQGRVDPEMTVSGEQLLFLINRLLSRQETAADETAEENQP